MTTKEKLLELFEKNKGIYLSGEEIAKSLNISRTAVWKTINALKNDGYEFDGMTKRGYLLSLKTDILSAQGIQKYLPQDSNYEILVKSVVSSTNTTLSELAHKGAKEGTILIANEQSHGRGRMNRSFYSPAKSGIYMSILLRPQKLKPSQSVKITTATAVAICETISEISGKKPSIKWVNDVFVDGKKVCGILTEGSFNAETDALEQVVVGIGINVYNPKNGFPKELINRAGVVFDVPQNDGKNRLCADFLIRFFKYYNMLDSKEYIEKYRALSMVTGKRVNFISANTKKSALAVAIDDNCRLILRYDDGREENVCAGEIEFIDKKGASNNENHS